MRVLKSKNGVIRALKNNDTDFSLGIEILNNDEFISELIKEYTEEEKTITRILEILIEKDNTEILKDIFDILAREGKIVKYLEILKNLKPNLKAQLTLHAHNNGKIVKYLEILKNLKPNLKAQYTYLFFNSKYGLDSRCLKDYKIILKENATQNLINLKEIEKLTNEYQSFKFIEEAVETINDINSRIKSIKRDFEYDYIENVDFLLNNFDFIEK